MEQAAGVLHLLQSLSCSEPYSALAVICATQYMGQSDILNNGMLCLPSPKMNQAAELPLCWGMQDHQYVFYFEGEILAIGFPKHFTKVAGAWIVTGYILGFLLPSACLSFL